MSCFEEKVSAISTVYELFHDKHVILQGKNNMSKLKTIHSHSLRIAVIEKRGGENE